MLDQIKTQLTLATRSDKMSREHVEKAAELLAAYIDNNNKKAITRLFVQPVTRATRPNSGKDKLLTALRIRVYPVTINTLASDAGITKASAYTYIKELRQDGYAIENIRAGTRKGKYQLARKGA
mgnify:FL=1